MHAVKIEQGTGQGETADPVTLTGQELALIGGGAGGISGTGRDAIVLGGGISGSG